MAGLAFTLQADLKKFNDLKKAIKGIKDEIKGLPYDSPQIKALEGQLAKLTEKYNKLGRELAVVQAALKEINKAEELVRNTQKQNQQTEKLIKNHESEADSLISLKREVANLEKAWLSLSQAERTTEKGNNIAKRIAENNAQIKLAKDGLKALQREYINTKKVQDLQEGSLKALRAQLSNLNNLYDSMSRTNREGAYGKAVLSSIQEVTTELNTAEQASMRFQRNVGNYASGFNTLGLSIQQVARELPSLSYGFGTFMSAISNNLPMLADELARANKEYKELAAKGEKAIPVWKQVTKSVFSWQTALVAGVTIMTMYNKEITQFVKSVFSSKKALSETFASTKEFQKGVADSSASLIGTLEKLSEGWKKLGNDIESQKQYLIDNKDAIDSLGQSITDVNEAENLFNRNKDAFILSILQRAKAAAIMEVASEEYKKAVQKMMEADAMPDKVKTFKQTGVDSHGALVGEWVEVDNQAKRDAKKEAEDMFKEGSNLIKKYAQFSEEERKILEGIGIKSANTMIKGSVEAIEAAIAIKRDALKKATNKDEYNRIEAEIKAEEAKLKAITGEKEKYNANNYVDVYNQTKGIERSSQAIKTAVEKHELSIQQQQIDLMKEGGEKQLAQIKHNYRVRYAEIEKEEKELLDKLIESEREQWERENPNYKEKGLQFIPSATLSDSDKERFDKDRELAYQKMESDSQNLLDKMLKKYQDYEAQKVEIERQGNEDIAFLMSQRNDENSAEIDRAIGVAKDKMEKGVQKINDVMAEEAMKDNGFFKMLYGDVSEMSFDSLRVLISQAKQLKEYLSGNGTKEGITFITKEQLEAIEKSPEELDKLKKALDRLLKSGKGKDKWSEIFDTFKKGFAELKDAKGFTEIASSIGQISNAAKSASDSLSKMFEEMGATAVSGVFDAFGSVFNSVSNIGQGFASGGLVGGIATAVGEAANWIGKAFAANNRHKEALKEIMNQTITQQREYNILLMEQNLLYEQGTTIFGNNLYGKAKNAVNVLSDANKEFSKELSKLGDVEIVTGHKKTGLFGWGKGKDIYSSILEVYPQLISSAGEFNRELAETILNTQSMKDEDKEALEYLIDLSNQVEETFDELNSYLTDIFGDLGNTMMNTLSEAFKKGTYDAEMYIDSVSGMLEELAEQMIYSVTLAPLMEKTQKQMTSVMQSGGLTDKQKFEQWANILNGLVNDAVSQQNIANNLMEQYKQTAEQYGFDIFKSEGYSQKASSGTSFQMTQDQASSLEGRFTALQLIGERAAKDISLMNVTMNDIKVVGERCNTHLESITDIAANSYIELMGINMNTEQSAKYLKSIDSGISEMKRKLDSL